MLGREGGGGSEGRTAAAAAGCFAFACAEMSALNDEAES